MQKECVELGLVCEDCVSRTAQQLAQSCKGLPGRLLSQMFVQLYPEPECSRMSVRFAAAYRNVSEVIPKRPVQSVRSGRRMVAEDELLCAAG